MQDARRGDGEFGVIQRWLRLSLGFALMAGTATVLMGLAVVLIPFRNLRIWLMNAYSKALGPVLIRLSGSRVRILNRERLEGLKPAVYVFNHASALDALLIMVLFPWGSVAIGKKEVVRIPFFGQAFWLGGNLLLDRGNLEVAIEAMDSLIPVVQRHRLSIWISPEGTRDPDGRLRPLKKGFVHVALATGLPLVPIAIRGAQVTWPARTFRIGRGPVEVEVLEAVDTSRWSLDTIDEHVAQIHGILAAHLGPEQQPA